MATALPTAPDMSAVRRKLQEGLGKSASAIGAMPYDPTWDNRAADAYGSLGTKLSANDISSQRLNQDYETNRAQQTLGQEQALTGTRNNFANNGNLFSGAYVDKQADTNRQFQDVFANLSSGRTRGLEDLDRSNTAAMTDYQRSIADLGTGYTKSIQDYLANQAKVTAGGEQQQQMLAAQRKLQELIGNPEWMRNLYEQRKPMSGMGGGM